MGDTAGDDGFGVHGSEPYCLSWDFLNPLNVASEERTTCKGPIFQAGESLLPEPGDAKGMNLKLKG